MRWIGQVLRTTNPVSTRLTREGLQFLFMIAFILFGAVLRDVNLLIFLAGSLLAMVLIQWRVCARTLLDVTVDRRLPRSIHARRPFEIELILRNPKYWLGAWWVLVQDRMVFSPVQSTINRASQTISLLFLSVPPRSSRSQKYRCVADRRGRYQLMGIELTTRFPLGLMRGILNQKGAVYFTVQPALGRLLPAWKELFLVRHTGTKQRRVRSLSDEGEFFGLRAYRTGDSPRWIHWRSSARRDELVVKQFQQPESRELVIALDLLIPADTSEEARRAYIKVEDTAVEFVATLVHQMTHGNVGSITIAIADYNPTLASRVSARSHGHALLDRLANARGSTIPTLSRALQLLEREQRHVQHLIVISTRNMPSQWADPDGPNVTPFWQSIQWIDTQAGETNKYFVPSE
jgi:uncharacterized protein (DUF58 family)